MLKNYLEAVQKIRTDKSALDAIKAIIAGIDEKIKRLELKHVNLSNAGLKPSLKDVEAETDHENKYKELLLVELAAIKKTLSQT
jgi:hypothetical protein